MGRGRNGPRPSPAPAVSAAAAAATPTSPSAIAQDAASVRVRCIADIVQALVAAFKAQGRVNVAQLKMHVCQKYGMATTPKLMEIIAAVPEDFRDKLAPFLRAKPVRTASGIAVVAVMSKPHRCPHIALTGSVCQYWCVSCVYTF